MQRIHTTVLGERRATPRPWQPGIWWPKYSKASWPVWHRLNTHWLMKIEGVGTTPFNWLVHEYSWLIHVDSMMIDGIPNRPRPIFTRRTNYCIASHIFFNDVSLGHENHSAKQLWKVTTHRNCIGLSTSWVGHLAEYWRSHWPICTLTFCIRNDSEMGVSTVMGVPLEWMV